MRPFAAVLALAACSTPQAGGPASPSDGSGRLVSASELSAAQREAWAAWQKGGPAWEIALDRVRADPELARFVVDNLVRVCVQAYGRSGLAPAGAAPGPFERAQADLVVLADHSTPVLVELLRLPDGIVAFLAADRLVAIGARANEPVAALLGDERSETRRRAAELSGKLPHAGVREVEIEKQLAARVEGDREWTVRGEAARALGARGARHDHKGYAMGVLLRALGDSDAMVARSAALGLGTLGEPTAIPRMADALQRAAAAGDPALVQAIQRALASIAGDNRNRSPEEWRRYRPQAPAAGASGP